MNIYHPLIHPLPTSLLLFGGQAWEREEYIFRCIDLFSFYYKFSPLPGLPTEQEGEVLQAEGLKGVYKKNWSR
jgi:hypothetical protein